jgi:hypothetical protein
MFFRQTKYQLQASRHRKQLSPYRQAQHPVAHQRQAKVNDPLSQITFFNQHGRDHLVA